MPLVLTRRSIREGFEERQLPADVLDAIIEAGLGSPSSKNAQPWRLHVVTARPRLVTLADMVQSAKDAERYVPIDPATGQPRQWTSTVAESAEVLRSVSAGIFVENRGEFSGGRRTVLAADRAVLPSALVGYGLEMAGLGAAVHGMWLAAETLGVVGVFMGDVAVAEDAIARDLGLRGDLLGVLALGYSDVAPFPKRLLDDRVVRHD